MPALPDLDFRFAGSAPRHAPRGLPQERLAELFRAHHGRLLAAATRITRDADAAFDAVQSGFEKALRAASGFEGRSLPSTWLHRIVVNEALMHLRRERRNREVPAADGDLDALGIEADDRDAEQRLLHEEQLRALRRGLERLDPDDRSVLQACGLGDESYAAFGRRRGLHPGAVKSRAFRARQRLAQLIQHERERELEREAVERKAG